MPDILICCWYVEFANESAEGRDEWFEKPSRPHERFRVRDRQMCNSMVAGETLAKSSLSKQGDVQPIVEVAHAGQNFGEYS